MEAGLKVTNSFYSRMVERCELVVLRQVSLSSGKLFKAGEFCDLHSTVYVQYKKPSLYSMLMQLDNRFVFPLAFHVSLIFFVYSLN